MAGLEVREDKMARKNLKKLFVEMVAQRGELLALFIWIGMCAYLLLCLVPFWESPPRWVGPVGQSLAGGLRRLFGWEAWLIPFVLSGLAWAKTEGWLAWDRQGFRRTAGFGLAGLTALGFGGLAGPSVAGIVGLSLGQIIEKYFGLAGAWVLLTIGGAVAVYLLELDGRFIEAGAKIGGRGWQAAAGKINGLGTALSNGLSELRLAVAGLMHRNPTGSTTIPLPETEDSHESESPQDILEPTDVEFPSRDETQDDDEADGDEEDSDMGLEASEAQELVEEEETEVDEDEIVDGTSVDDDSKESTGSQLKPIQVSPPGLDMLGSDKELDKSGSSLLQETQSRLLETLSTFGIEAKPVGVVAGPSVTRFELKPAPGIKVSKFHALADDIALALEASPVRVVTPVPGKAAVGIEIPNPKRTKVSLRSVLSALEAKNDPSPLLFSIGQSMSGDSVVADLPDMPHLLVGGATGSGKSAFIHSLIVSLLSRSTPDQVRFLLVDPKRVELAPYAGMPHLVCPVITEPKRAAQAIRGLVKEMEHRYTVFAKNGVRDLASYWEKVQKRQPKAPRLPAIVVVIDELADLMLVAAAQVENAIARLAQMARGVGIHLIFATQNPTVTVITGTIKANFPSRIALRVSSMVYSRIILDVNGAEKLLGRGDMLYHPSGMPSPERIQGCFVAQDEIRRIVAYWKGRCPTNYLMEDIGEDVQEMATGLDEEVDEMYTKAVHLVQEAGSASTSFLQRRLSIGYGRAARILDQMEQKGVVGPARGSKAREVMTPGEAAE